MKKMLAVLLSVVLLAATGSSALADTDITLSAGAVGGSWYMYGALFNDLWTANIPGLNATLIAGAGNSNPYAVDNNESQLGFTYVHTARDAYNGQGVSAQPAENIRLLMNIRSIFYFTCMLDKSLGITSFDDIKEKKPALVCAVGAAGSGSEEVFRAVFEAHGITYEDIESWGGRIEYVGGGSGADLFRDGHVNVLSNAAPQPYSTWVEVAASRDVVLLPIDDTAADAMKELGYDVDTIDTTPYGDPTGMILSAGPTSILIVNKDVDEELVYQMTKLLYENFDNLIEIQSDLRGFDPENAANADIPLHPGAERYYREIGLIQE
jgi:TRAP transporter TAXI family solute receptor